MELLAQTSEAFYLVWLVRKNIEILTAEKEELFLRITSIFYLDLLVVPETLIKENATSLCWVFEWSQELNAPGVLIT